MMSASRLALAAATLVMAFAFALPAEARDNHRRGHDRGNDRGHVQRDWRGDSRSRGNDRHDRRDRRHARGYDRRHDRRDTRVVYVPRPLVVHHPRGHRGPPPWARGRHYGYSGYAPTYVVNQYGHYGLRQPPRGHHWRRSDAGDFLLVAIATGIIADVITGR
ncbi:MULTISPECIES: RcnB family protein [unclassified Luteimonas]